MKQPSTKQYARIQQHTELSEESSTTSSNNKLDFFKKLNLLNPFEISVLFLLAFVLICSFFYFEYSAVINGASRLGFGGGGGRYRRGSVSSSSSSGEECDYFDGKWVYDETYPLYNSKDCPFADVGFRCLENTRPDNSYAKWRWQPNQCDLPRQVNGRLEMSTSTVGNLKGRKKWRFKNSPFLPWSLRINECGKTFELIFDAKVMLEKLRNKRIVFVGDSIGRNQWESLLCMLSSAINNKTSIYEVNGNLITKHMGYLVFRFRDYNCTVEYYRAPFLVVQGRPPAGSPSGVRYTLRVDHLDWTATKWKDADVLIFNAGHWWTYDKTLRSGCYFQEGNELKMNMTVEAAFRRSIETLHNWVDTQVNLTKTSVYFRSYAPIHFRGGDWKDGGSCHLETTPDLEAPYLPQTWWHYNIVNSVLSNHAKTSSMSTLDVTYLSLQRKDGHPSLYYMEDKPAPLHRQDCSHWCLPGVPDTWNELLYTVLRNQSLHSGKSSNASQSEA